MRSAVTIRDGKSMAMPPYFSGMVDRCQARYHRCPNTAKASPGVFRESPADRITSWPRIVHHVADREMFRSGLRAS